MSNQPFTPTLPQVQVRSWIISYYCSFMDESKPNGMGYRQIYLIGDDEPTFDIVKKVLDDQVDIYYLKKIAVVSVCRLGYEDLSNINPDTLKGIMGEAESLGVELI